MDNLADYLTFLAFLGIVLVFVGFFTMSILEFMVGIILLIISYSLDDGHRVYTEYRYECDSGFSTSWGINQRMDNGVLYFEPNSSYKIPEGSLCKYETRKVEENIKER